MKYSITHCYTDKNKGDAAIVVSTMQLLRHLDPEANISLYSTYGVRDSRFRTDHNLTKEYADNLYPAFFPEPVSASGSRSQYKRIIPFVLSLLKSLLLLISKNSRYVGCILRGEDRTGFEAFIRSDVIISKGGSFLYTENSSLRSSLSLIRMLYPFIISLRYKKKVVIFSQSLGPVIGVVNNLLFKRVLSNVDHIYLRESLCVDQYPAVREVCAEKFRIVPDTAFYLKNSLAEVDTCIPIDTNAFNVGFTFVNNDYKYLKSKADIATKKENYKKCMIDSIKFLVDRYAAVVHVFPQVLVDMSYEGHNDLVLSEEIKQALAGTRYHRHINVYTTDFHPVQLRNLYRQMDLFIGTRLHSVIFALSASVPSINVAYHGTKAQGILNQLDDQNSYVLDINTVSSQELIGKIQELYERSGLIRAELPDKIADLNESLENAMKQVLTTVNS